MMIFFRISCLTARFWNCKRDSGPLAPDNGQQVREPVAAFLFISRVDPRLLSMAITGSLSSFLPCSGSNAAFSVLLVVALRSAAILGAFGAIFFLSPAFSIQVISERDHQGPPVSSCIHPLVSRVPLVAAFLLYRSCTISKIPNFVEIDQCRN